MFHTIESIKVVCDKLHSDGKTIVLATGFFDLFHSEHLNFLRHAASHGDVLIVAVESDERARALKGEGRPVEPLSLRCQKVLKYSDYVIALAPNFDNFEAYDSLMAAIKPNIYAVSTHTEHQKNKTFLTEKYGGKLVAVHAWNPEVSTTQILNNKNQV